MLNNCSCFVVVIVDMWKAETEADLQERWVHLLLCLLHESWPHKTTKIWICTLQRLVHPFSQHRLGGNGGDRWRKGGFIIPLYYSEVKEGCFMLIFIPYFLFLLVCTAWVSAVRCDILRSSVLRRAFLPQGGVKLRCLLWHHTSVTTNVFVASRVFLSPNQWTVLCELHPDYTLPLSYGPTTTAFLELCSTGRSYGLLL